MKKNKKEYLQSIKRGIKRHLEECEHMIEAADNESDYKEERREYWIREKEKSEEKLEQLERENGVIDEEETQRENINKEIEEEITEEEEREAEEEGWDSASQAREWIRSSKEMDKFLKEKEKRNKLNIIEDLYAIGLSPEEVYGVADEYDELIEEAAGEKEDENEENEELFK